MAKRTSKKRRPKRSAPSGAGEMCVQCRIGKQVIVLTEAECAAQGGIPVSRPFPRPASGIQAAAEAKNVAKSVKKTTRKTASAGPAPRVIEPKRPSLLDLCPPLHDDYHAAHALFRHDLDELLNTKPSRWLVYTKDGPLPGGEADDAETLYRLCRERGLVPGSYLVAHVVPPQPAMEIPDEWFLPDDE